jgi:hypothetical protein
MPTIASIVRNYTLGRSGWDNLKGRLAGQA